jgi:hypothetical protein
MEKQLIISQHALTLIFEELKFADTKQKIQETGGGKFRYAPKKAIRENLDQLWDGKRLKHLKEEI